MSDALGLPALHDSRENRGWTRDEQILAFNLYCKTPFSKISARSNPDIAELAKLINRSSSAVALKLVNYARLDPALQKRNVAGMRHGSKADTDIWNEFHNDWDGLAWHSESALTRLMTTEPSAADIPPSEASLLNEIVRDGEEREVTVRARVNQAFFRRMILASYSFKCCITGIDIPQLLVASHIVPWTLDVKNRMNPRNGLCLSALYDRAFDTGLITVTPDLRIKISSRITESGSKLTANHFIPYADMSITPPNKFYPSEEFLDFHNKKVFLG